MSDTKTPAKKHSVRPEEPKAETAPVTEKKLIELQPWPDGSLFKFMKAHGKEGQEVFPILGQTKTKTGEVKAIQLAGTPHFEIADMICNAVNVVAQASKSETAQAAPENITPLPTAEEKK